METRRVPITCDSIAVSLRNMNAWKSSWTRASGFMPPSPDRSSAWQQRARLIARPTAEYLRLARSSSRRDRNDGLRQRTNPTPDPARDDRGCRADNPHDSDGRPDASAAHAPPESHSDRRRGRTRDSHYSRKYYSHRAGSNSPPALKLPAETPT